MMSLSTTKFIIRNPNYGTDGQIILNSINDALKTFSSFNGLAQGFVLIKSTERTEISEEDITPKS